MSYDYNYIIITIIYNHVIMNNNYNQLTIGVECLSGSQIWSDVFQHHLTHESGKSFIQPDIVPPIHSH